MADAASERDATGFGWIGAAAPEQPAPEPESIWSEWNRTVDHWTILACFALFGIGVVLACATSPDLAESVGERRGVELSPFHFAQRHAYFLFPAAASLIFLSFLSPRAVRRLGVFVALIALVGLGLVLELGVEHGKSARRWFSVGGYSVQPSEFLKPGLVVMSAWLLSAIAQARADTARWAVSWSFAIAAFSVFLLILQPDYGQSALILVVWAAMYFVAGGSILALLAVFIAAASVGYIAYFYEPHIAARIDAFIDTSIPVHGQVGEAYKAIQSGGWLGLGVGEGVRKGSLPDAHADFVIAVAAEEYGFLFVAVIIFFFSAITLRALWRAKDVSDPFARLAAVGLALLFGLQAMVHLGVSARLLPATGMTLPFVSNGGSSMLASAFTVGLLLALTRRPVSED